MDCSYFQELLSAMKDGELTKDEELRLSEHLRACDACRKFASELADTSKRLTGLGTTAIPSEVESRILRATTGLSRREKEAVGFWRGSYLVPKKLAWAIAALLALLIVNSSAQFIKTESQSGSGGTTRGKVPTVQHIVLTEQDVVSSYTRFAEGKN